MQTYINLTKSCRSRQELSNEYLLAKIDFATAENEPLKAWRCFNSSFQLAPSLQDPAAPARALRGGRAGGAGDAGGAVSAPGAALHEGHAPGEAAEAAACGCSNSKLERNVPT